MIQVIILCIYFLVLSSNAFGLSEQKVDSILNNGSSFQDRTRAKLKKYFEESQRSGYKRPTTPRVLKKWMTQEEFIAAVKSHKGAESSTEDHAQGSKGGSIKSKNTESMNGDQADESSSTPSKLFGSGQVGQVGEEKGDENNGDDTQWQTVGPLGPNIRKESQEPKPLTPEELQYAKEKEEYLKKFKSKQ